MARKQRRDTYAEITDRIVEALDRGVAPWVKPWSASAADGRPADWPRNASSGRPYNGINVWLLLLTALERGYAAPRWLTYRQAKAAGGHVRKGEKGTQVVFWRFVQREQENDDGTTTTKSVPILRLYTVFNVDQVEGLDEAKLWAPEAAVEVDTDERVQAILDALAADGCVHGHSGDRAFYSPTIDAITLPRPHLFEGRAAYAATALHECAHATGHSKRLDRQFGRRFGDDAYAFEELVAEMASAYLCAHAGIEGRLQHAEYLGHWAKVLKADKYAIFTAAKAAEQAAEWLFGRAEALADETNHEAARAA